METRGRPPVVPLWDPVIPLVDSCGNPSGPLASVYSYFMTARCQYNICEQVLHVLIEILRQCSFKHLNG